MKINDFTVMCKFTCTFFHGGKKEGNWSCKGMQ